MPLVVSTSSWARMTVFGSPTTCCRAAHMAIGSVACARSKEKVSIVTPTHCQVEHVLEPCQWMSLSCLRTIAQAGLQSGDTIAVSNIPLQCPSDGATILLGAVQCQVTMNMRVPVLQPTNRHELTHSTALDSCAQLLPPTVVLSWDTLGLLWISLQPVI